MIGTIHSDPVGVTAYPVGWRIERAKEDVYRQFGYVQ